MPINGTKSKINPRQSLAAFASLSDSQLERLLPQVFVMSAGRGRHVLAARESELLERINRGLPSNLQTDCKRLVQRRRDGTLTESQVRRLHRLTGKVEQFDAQRLRCLVELAGLRKTTFESCSSPRDSIRLTNAHRDHPAMGNQHSIFPRTGGSPWPRTIRTTLKI